MTAVHTLRAVALVASLTAWSVLAQQTQGSDHASHHPPAAEAALPGTDFVEGEVLGVDAANGKIALQHGPIPNLQMPEMTMVFQALDPGMLVRLKPGDKIRFKADRIDGADTVTVVEPAR